MTLNFFDPRECRRNGDVDMAREALNHPSSLPPTAARDFGPGTQQLAALAHDTNIIEIDALQLAGQLKKAEFTEYIILHPDSKRVSSELRKVADTIYAAALPRIPGVIAKAYSNNRFRDMKTILDFFDTILQFVSSQSSVSEIRTHRAFLLNRFMDNLFEKFSIAMFHEVAKSKGVVAARDFSGRLSTILHGPKQSEPAKPFRGAKALRNVIDGQFMVRENPEASKEIFDDLTQDTVDFNTPDNFAMIEDFSHLKKITPINIETANGAILIEERPENKSGSIVCITVCLNKKRIEKDGEATKFPPKYTMSFTLDRSSGIVLIDGTQQAAQLVLGSARYRAFKSFVYKKLLENFTETEFSDEEEPDEEVEIETTIDNERADAREQIAAQELVGELPPVAKRRNRSKREIQAENFTLDNLRGLQCDRILGALKKIRDYELPDGGSHYKFFPPKREDVPPSSRGQVSFPFHSGDTLGIRILKIIMRELEITPQELFNAL